MIRRVDGSQAGRPGSDATAVVAIRGSGNRLSIEAAVIDGAPGNWGDDVGGLASDLVGNHGVTNQPCWLSCTG